MDSYDSDVDISIMSLDSDSVISDHNPEFSRVSTANPPSVIQTPSTQTSSSITEEIRQSIWHYHHQNPKKKQHEIVEWARKELSISSITQSAVSRILRYKSEAARSGNLTQEQARKIYERSQQKPKLTQVALAKWAQTTFNLAKAPGQSTISNIVNKKRSADAEISKKNASLKRRRSLKCPELEHVLVEWILRCQNDRVCLSWQLVQKQARRFADKMNIPESQKISFSDGWIGKFLTRNGLKGVKLQGESGSADVEAIKEAMPDLLETIARYSPCDVFNMDETGLFYCMAPDRTIASRQMEGMKKSKTRMTVALCANADGTEKLEPFFIGHYLKPRAFQKQSGDQLGLYYRANSKAWMTATLFQEWLLKQDKKMRLKGRNILLLLDNAPSHVIKNIDLTNIEVCFFPPNATSRFQPMDQGIIAAFKKIFRSIQLDHALDRYHAGEQEIYKVDILRAMKWCKLAWNMITSTTISNCWNHSGLIVDDQDVAVLFEASSETDIDKSLEETMARLEIETPMPVGELIGIDAVPVDSTIGMIDDTELLEIVRVDEEEPEDKDCIFLPENTHNTILPKALYSFEEKAKALNTSIEILSEHPEVYHEGIMILRRALHELQHAEKQKKQQTLKQVTLHSYFTNEQISASGELQNNFLKNSRITDKSRKNISYEI